MAEIRYMSVKEFRREGYLQELNRRFLHPLGLAIEVVVEDGGHESFGGIWDFRNDREGVRYGGEILAHLPRAARRIDELWREREPDRVAALGFMVQPASLEDEPG